MSDVVAVTLQSPTAALPGVGPTRANGLRELGVETVGQLLEYFPRKYDEEVAEMAIDQMDGDPDRIHTFRGEVVACDYITGRGRPRFEATIDDGSDQISLTWFNGSFLRGRIRPGMMLRVRGKVREFRGISQMSNPKWEPIGADTEAIAETKYRAVYSAGSGLSSAQIASSISAALAGAAGQIAEWFSKDLLKSRELIDRPVAYRQIHDPKNAREAKAAHRRLVYDELMLLQLGLMIARRQDSRRLAAPILRIDKTLDARIRARFPFELTDAQQNAAWQIVKDMRQGQAMNRLLQGDVGSGKTVVALYAMLVAVANRMQAAILAPTEVLAEQHYFNLSAMLEGSEVRVGLFTGKSKRAQVESLDALRAGRIHLAIGTQALLQGDIEFGNLGIVVVDEQHKLGVRQRGTLRGKGLSPHYLVMTATPIPRTLALSYFADFDVSSIDALPPGRIPIKTRWLPRTREADAYAFVRSEIEKGRQAYVVVPRIESDGVDETTGLIQRFEQLKTGPLKDLSLGMLHGRMKTQEKHAAMAAFRANQTSVLLATTVIEVGVDVPNSTVMVIENADQFGLAQLHQLRGRVGRGSEQSHCLLIADAANDVAEKRLSTMVKTSDGFEIAEADLSLRGPGDFFGTRQHGLPELKLADISSEFDMLKVTREDAETVLAHDLNLKKKSNAALRGALIERYGSTLELASIS